jgi:hypothetical protein
MKSVKLAFFSTVIPIPPCVVTLHRINADLKLPSSCTHTYETQFCTRESPALLRSNSWKETLGPLAKSIYYKKRKTPQIGIKPPKILIILKMGICSAL